MRFTQVRRSLIIAMCLGFTVLGGTAQLVNAQIQTKSIPLTVRVDQPLGAINPYVYGVNDGPWSVVSPDVMGVVKAAGLTYLRFPAGNWGDENDLTPFNIDMFMTFARQIQAEPSISVRLKHGSPQAAAALVQYTNIEKKYAVHYWSIGNEPDLYPNYSVEQYIRDWRQFADAMRAVDPSIIFVGPDISQYPPITDSGAAKYHDWLRAFLKADGDLVNFVSVHRYPFPKGINGKPTTIDQLKSSASEWDTLVPDMRALIHETTGRDLPIGVTEINSSWSDVTGGQASPDSFYNAIWWADSLGRMIRQRVAIVAYFTLYTTTSPESFGLLSHYDARPTYYVYQMYRQLGTALVATESPDPDVTLTAALRSDGTLTVMLINPTRQTKSVILHVSGFNAPRQADLWLLDPTHLAKFIGTVPDPARSVVTLPAQSVSVYLLESTF